MFGFTTDENLNKNSNNSDVHGLAQEHERRCRGITTPAAAAEPPKPLIIVNTEQRKRELHLIPSPDSAHPVRVPEFQPSAESTQYRTNTNHVEPLVATESDNNGTYAGGRRRDMAKAEVFPERVIAGNSAPEATNAGGDTK